MRTIVKYIISSFLLILSGTLAAQKPAVQEPPDTVVFPLTIRASVDVAGPVIYLTNKNVLNTEASISADLNEKKALFFSGGYSNYTYSQYNYSFKTRGMNFKAGMDFNLLKPELAAGKYWAGVGIHYGISAFSWEIPSINYENYWGKVTTQVSKQTGWAHFIEFTPGFRAKMIGPFSLGWSLAIRKMIYTGSGSDTGPVYFPGYGNKSKSFAAGINYYLIWNFRYKTIKVLIPKEVQEEPTDENNTDQEIKTVD